MLSSYCIVSQNIMRSLYCIFFFFLFLLLKISMIQVIILNTGEIVIFPWTYLGGCNSCVFLVFRIKFNQTMIDFDYLIKAGIWKLMILVCRLWNLNTIYMYSAFSICLRDKTDYPAWCDSRMNVYFCLLNKGINFSFYRLKYIVKTKSTTFRIDP